jgi:protein phosphatase
LFIWFNVKIDKILSQYGYYSIYNCYRKISVALNQFSMVESSSQRKGIADKIISAFNELLTIPPDNFTDIGRTVAIPTFDPPLLTELAKRAEEHFALQNTLLNVSCPVYIVGDIHGNIFDLIRVLIMAGVPPISRFLFLGDYVDRGQYSIEVIALLFSLSIRYPEHVYLLRGNHEF